MAAVSPMGRRRHREYEEEARREYAFTRRRNMEKRMSVSDSGAVVGDRMELWCEEVTKTLRIEVGVAQNAAHLLRCPGVADGKGRRWEEIWDDPEWCEGVAEAVRR
ncbi:hypothetical protein EV426DRAFT_721806 [Tirmania nivea]|nr:hypothetical protein EV426DRAFT_721806 [Tirmania nivea]